jgi:hypothetical protein
MTAADRGPALEPFLAAAEVVTCDRPEVDAELAREVFEEAATLLHDGLVLDHLDDHDTQVVVTGLCEALVAPDPGAAVRARAAAAGAGDLHDPAEVRAAYLVAASVLQL